MRSLLVYSTIAAGTLYLSGCAPLVIAYPKVSHFPAVELAAPPAEIHPFLVKTDRTETFETIFVPTKQSIRPLDRPDESELGSHTGVSITAWAGLIMVLSHGYGYNCSFEMRIYRPGYDLVVVKPWEDLSTITWTEAKTLIQQELALDEILGGDKWHPYSILGPIGYWSDFLIRDWTNFRDWANNGDITQHDITQLFGRPWYPTNSRLVVDANPSPRWDRNIEPLSDEQRREILFIADEYDRLASMLVDALSQQRAHPMSPPPLPLDQSIAFIDPSLDGEEQFEILNRLKEKGSWLRDRCNNLEALR